MVLLSLLFCRSSAKLQSSCCQCVVWLQLFLFFYIVTSLHQYMSEPLFMPSRKDFACRWDDEERQTRKLSLFFNFLLTRKLQVH